MARRANALVLLDDGWSCERVAIALLLDDDTIRRWHGLFVSEGLEGLTRFEAAGGAYISQAFGVVYESCIGSSLCCIGSASNIASRK
jgi:hypothetical protein